LVAEPAAIVPGEPFWVGLHFVMDEGWHVNWRNPGDAGLAPTVAWTLPDGFVAGEIHWPYPEVISESKLVSYGYHGEVLLPVQIFPSPPDLEPGATVEIAAETDWIACRDVCLAEAAALNLTLAVAESPEIDSIWQPRFEQAKAKLPVVLPDWRATMEVKSETIEIHLTGPADVTVDNVYFAPFAASVIAHGAAQEWTATESGYTLTLARPRNAKEPVEVLAGLLLNPLGWTGPGSPIGMEIEARAASPEPSWPLTTGGVLLGGLLLALGVWGIRRLH
jgi:thiol:disulfide interchange protein DsbD